MREEVEELESGAIGEVVCVGVDVEGEVGVGGIFVGEVGCEVPEGACGVLAIWRNGGSWLVP